MEEKFTLFYGGPFGNFFLASFEDRKGTKFSCTEQYYMGMKALYFKDQDRYLKIMATTNPKTQKKHGRKVKNFDHNKWYSVAKQIMYKGNYYKYTQNLKLKKLLFDTKNTTLVEASPWDAIWGIKMEACAEAYDRNNWQGTNWLGEVLTNLREDLIKEEEKTFLF